MSNWIGFKTGDKTIYNMKYFDQVEIEGNKITMFHSSLEMKPVTIIFENVESADFAFDQIKEKLLVDIVH